jgi:purine nucleoside phosphorylase
MDERLRKEGAATYLYETHKIHDLEMVDFAKKCAKECDINLIDGCYSYWALPQFETPAEI